MLKYQNQKHLSNNLYTVMQLAQQQMQIPPGAGRARCDAAGCQSQLCLAHRCRVQPAGAAVRRTSRPARCRPGGPAVLRRALGGHSQGLRVCHADGCANGPVPAQLVGGQLPGLPALHAVPTGGRPGGACAEQQRQRRLRRAASHCTTTDAAVCTTTDKGAASSA